MAREKMEGPENAVKGVFPPKYDGYYEKDLAKFKPVPTNSNPNVACGYTVLANPDKPKFPTREGAPQRGYTSSSSHFSPLGATRRPSASYLNGKERRPGGSSGHGHVRK